MTSDRPKNPISPIPNAKEQLSGKPKRIPPKISQIIDWLVSGACKNQQAACERANLDPSYVSRELRKVHVRVFIERRARETLAGGMMRASARLLELMESASDHVSLDAVKHELGLNGIKPAPDAGMIVTGQAPAGFVIDLTEPGGATIRISSHVPRREGDDAIDVTPNEHDLPLMQGDKHGR
jgi:hypothetical protein